MTSEARSPQRVPQRVVEIQILSGGHSGQVLRFPDPQAVRFGRDESAEVAFSRRQDLTVSHSHAELRREGADFVLYDTGSRNGTLLLPGREPVQRLVLPLSAATEIELGPGGPRCRILLLPAQCQAETTFIEERPARQPGTEDTKVEAGPAAPLTVPFGRYLLTGRLGQGGMAELYVARQQGLGGFDREVALKLIRPDLYEVTDAASMLLDEARIISEISHPNVVQVYDVGEQGGVLFIAMEYLRGVTLLQLALQAQQQGELLPPDLCAALLSQACAGLHAAHELRDRAEKPRQVVHRDVSPQNLMCSLEGVVKVIDFGVARAEGRLSGTQAGQVKGKLGYMSPEQVRAQPLDRRSDVFSLGVVLFELCSGRRLFQRDNDLHTIAAVTRAEVPPLQDFCPHASPGLIAALGKALRLAPADRYPTAAAFMEDLQEVVAEAGGRFSSQLQVSRYLHIRGFQLTGIPPRPLSQPPMALIGPPVRQPAARPTAAQLGLLLQPVEASERSADLTWLSPPPSGEVCELTLGLPGGPGAAAERTLVLHALSLPAEQARDRVPVPLSQVPGLLPAPLLLLLRAGSLVVELERQPGPPGERPPGLYHDAHQPSTRRDSYLLSPGTREGSFDVGHRKSRVQKVHYACVVNEDGRDELSLPIPALQLGLALPGAPQQAVLLHTMDPRTGVVHAACVTLV